MWVYQTGMETSTAVNPVTEALIVPAQQAAPPVEEQPAPQVPKQEPPVQPAQNAPQPRPAARKATWDCWLLAAAFLLGSAAAGILQALRDAEQIEVLGYYLDAWRGLFAAGDLQHAVQLFGAEYFALAAAVSVLLLFGLSALGPVLIFLFMMLYGLGSGLLFLQLLSLGSVKAFLIAFLWTSIPATAANGCLCLFGASALQVSSRIHAYSFWNNRSGQMHPGVRVFLGQYLLTLVILLPLCGAATALSCLCPL